MENENNYILNRDGSNTSIWQLEPHAITTDKNPQNKDIFDVIIVGGGITGVTLGLLLQQQGKKCLIAEAKNLGFGTSSGTTAHINTFLDTSYPQIETDFGAEAAVKIANANKEVIDLIYSNVTKLNIDADFAFKDGFLFSENGKETDSLLDILAASQRAGVDVEKAQDNGVNIGFEQAIVFKNQAQFHPVKYILGLAQEFCQLGGVISEDTFIRKAEIKDGVYFVEADTQTFSAKNLVYATHIPPGVNLLSFRNAPYRSYVLGITLKTSNYPDALVYDMQEPYHYIRSHEIDGKKILILGGADHKTGHDDPEKAFQELEDYGRKNFDVDSVDYHWSSQYYVPVDGLPYIGQMPGGDDHTYVATGFNGNGMMLGTLSAMIISDLILEKANPYQELLSPSRLKPIAGFKDFIKENADVVYHFIADRFGIETLETATKLGRGEGEVVTVDGEKIALSKDNKGKLTALSPVCTHAGCIVNWNAAEKSWDCPCHGGRFSATGEVITGPPSENLKEIQLSRSDL